MNPSGPKVVNRALHHVVMMLSLAGSPFYRAGWLIVLCARSLRGIGLTLKAGHSLEP
jgi:hypothetical protein